MIFADFHEFWSDFLRFSRKALQLLGRFFNVIVNVIVLNVIFNLHTGTTFRSCIKDNPGAPASERHAWESQTDAPPLSSWELEWSSAAEIEGSSAADAAQRKKRAATIGLVAFLIVV